MARGQGHSVVNFLLVLQGFSPFPPAWGKAGMGGRDRMCCLPALHPHPSPPPSQGEGEGLRRGSILELRPKLFSELPHLWVDNHQTVGLIRIVTIVVLVVVFGLVESGQGRDLGNNGTRPESRSIGVALGFFCDDSLLLVVIENHRTILRADIIALSVQRGGIVGTPEHVEHLCKRNKLRIKRDLHDFRVPRRAIAYLIIRWVLDCTTSIAGTDAMHAS